jgi:hypothetical protein
MEGKVEIKDNDHLITNRRLEQDATTHSNNFKAL